ncbi:hypothetical protein ElyMa_007036100 [Elysia marginata]|uniref:Uncharacterized protein n=1 Tax=Elysia marginata TaxID=1093978 RepID=A0AAV4JUS9_9GAST|nr:hypothetical protein ElyMa_007036100 [Elysia marginata]
MKTTHVKETGSALSRRSEFSKNNIIKTNQVTPSQILDSTRQVCHSTEDRSGEVFSQCSCFVHGDSGTSCLNDDYNWSDELTSQLQSREHVWLLSTNHKGPPKSRSIVTSRWGHRESPNSLEK